MTKENAEKVKQLYQEIALGINNGEQVNEVLFKALKALQIINPNHEGFNECVDKVEHYLNVLRNQEDKYF